jgi:hypothetical protein
MGSQKDPRFSADSSPPFSPHLPHTPFPPARTSVQPPPKDMKNELVRTLMEAFDEATAAIPCWDEYTKTGVASYDCGEKPGGFLAEELERAKKGEGGGGAATSKMRMLR